MRVAADGDEASLLMHSKTPGTAINTFGEKRTYIIPYNSLYAVRLLALVNSTLDLVNVVAYNAAIVQCKEENLIVAQKIDQEVVDGPASTQGRAFVVVRSGPGRVEDEAGLR